MPDKPVITVKRKFPYLVSGLADGQLVDENNRPLPVRKPVTALCRCGRSASQPLCDGAHGMDGICDAKKCRTAGRVRDYPGRRIIIHDNRRLCSHDGSCLRLLPAVFNLERKPWIDADAAPAAEIIAAIAQCPSGALACTVDGIRQPDPVRPPRLRVRDNGPLQVSGSIELKDDLGSQPANPERYELCRCGQTGNIPFCDGTHCRPAGAPEPEKDE